MSLLKVRQRYSFSQVVYEPSTEVESQQQFHNVELLDIPPPSSRSFALWRHRLENLLWIASAAFIIYYGDFRSNLIALLVSDARIRRTPFNLGLACVVVDLSICLYLVFRLRFTDRMEERLEIVAPGAIPAATMIGLAAYILFSVALWPIWSFLTLPMLFTLFMALVVLAPYLVPYVDIKVDIDALRSLYIRSAE